MLQIIRKPNATQVVMYGSRAPRVSFGCHSAELSPPSTNIWNNLSRWSLYPILTAFLNALFNTVSHSCITSVQLAGKNRGKYLAPSVNPEPGHLCAYNAGRKTPF